MNDQMKFYFLFFKREWNDALEKLTISEIYPFTMANINKKHLAIHIFNSP